mgnify:CR=1 FL=1|jgi:hypothetical protein
MGKNHAELYSITPFKEDGRWYLHLVYRYEDKVGKHTVVIPKAELPFVQTSVPYPNRRIPYFPNSQFALEHPYIDCQDSMPLHEAVCALAIERGAENPACYFDIITEYASREMTLDEIEKELGYKVKIINKEKNNGNGKEM